MTQGGRARKSSGIYLALDGQAGQFSEKAKIDTTTQDYDTPSEWCSQLYPLSCKSPGRGSLHVRAGHWAHAKQKYVLHFGNEHVLQDSCPLTIISKKQWLILSQVTMKKKVLVRKKPTSHSRSGLLTNRKYVYSGLERDVVIHIREVRRRLRCLTRGRGVVAAVVHAAAVAHALTAAQHLHLLGDDVGRVLLDAVLVGVFTGLQAAFDVDRGTFFQVLADDFSQAAEEGDAVPLGQLFLLAGVAVLRFERGRHGDVGDRVTARHVANFRIATQIADDDDFVN